MDRGSEAAGGGLVLLLAGHQQGEERRLEAVELRVVVRDDVRLGVAVLAEPAGVADHAEP